MTRHPCGSCGSNLSTSRASESDYCQTHDDDVSESQTASKQFEMRNISTGKYMLGKRPKKMERTVWKSEFSKAWIYMEDDGFCFF